MLGRLLPPMIGASLASCIGAVVIDFVLIAAFCGTDGLAVLAFYLPLTYLWDIIDDSFCSGATTLFAIAKGEKAPDKAQAIFSQSLTFVLFACLLLGVVFSFLNPHLLDWFNLSGDLRLSAEKYGYFFAFASGANVLSNVARNFVNSDSAPNWAFVAVLVKMFFVIVLSIVFMGTMGSGVVGSQYALLIAGVVSSLVSLGYFTFGDSALKLRFAVLTFRRCKDILKLSYCKIIENLGVASLGVVFNYFLYHTFGSYAVVIQCALLTIYALFWSIGEPIIYAGCQIIGMYHGEEDNTGIKITAKTIMAIGLVISGMITLLLMGFPEMVGAGLALDIRSDSATWNNALRCFAVSISLSFFNLFVLAYYQTIGKTTMSFLLSLARSFAFPLIVGCILILFHRLNLFWFYFIISEVLVLLVLCAVVFSVPRKTGVIPVWLLPPRENHDKLIYHFMISDKSAELDDYIEMSVMFLENNGARAEHIASLPEGMKILAGYALDHAKPGEHMIDFRIQLLADRQIKMSVRWIGEHVDFGDNPDGMAGIIRLQELTDDYYYDRIYGFHYVSVLFRRKET